MQNYAPPAPRSYPVRLYLIGLPGSGKTTLAKTLGRRMPGQVTALDLDKRIEQHTGQTIASLFQAHGEAYFRALEAEQLRSLPPAPTGRLQVVATGGGAPLFHGNLAYLKATGAVVWLEVPLPALARRLANSNNPRPLFAGVSIAEKLEALAQARYPTYEQADVRLSARTPAEALEGILAQWEGLLRLAAARAQPSAPTS